MKRLIIWMYRKKTGLEKYQLSMAFSVYYFITRSRLKSYWFVWNSSK